jgi:hypothetical protein
VSIPQCRKITVEVTNALASEPDLRQSMRRMAAGPVDGAAVCELLARYLDEATAEDLRAEFRELPSVMGAQIVMAFALADAAGKAFVFESLAPEGPLAFARRRQVRFVLDMTADEVRLGVAHVAGRKAQWYQPHRRAEAIV